MKLWLVITMVALVAKCSSAKPVSSEMPPDHVFVEIIVNYTAAEVDRIGTMVRTTLPQIPQTDNYSAHRETLRKLLQQTEEFKNSSSCMDKALTFSQQFKQFLRFYIRPDDSAEFANILKLLANSDGLTDVKRDRVSVEHALILKLLIDNGLTDMQPDFEAFLQLVKSGEFGAPVKPGSAGYTKLLEEKC